MMCSVPGPPRVCENDPTLKMYRCPGTHEKITCDSYCAFASSLQAMAVFGPVGHELLSGLAYTASFVSKCDPNVFTSRAPEHRGVYGTQKALEIWLLPA